MAQPQPQTTPAPSFSNDLVVRALNYHGQQLTSFVKETKFFEHLDMKNVDYHLYHQRSRELRMEDRGKRLLLHRYLRCINWKDCFFLEAGIIYYIYIEIRYPKHR